VALDLSDNPTVALDRTGGDPLPCALLYYYTTFQGIPGSLQGVGSNEGTFSPRSAASHAAVRYSSTFRRCFSVATTVISRSTAEIPE